MENHTSDNSAKIAEYQATQQMWCYFGGIVWQVGSVLIAGVFLYWGFLLNINPFESCDNNVAVGLSLIFINLLLTGWIIFALYAHNLIMSKTLRLIELEKDMGMKQHIRIVKKDPRYFRSIGIRGMYLNILVYFLLSLGGPFIILAKGLYHFFLIGALIIVFASLIYTICVLYKLKKCEYYKEVEKYNEFAQEHNVN